ncbi:hypothetical protein Htur_4684 (plasmid) [Haloterrigena turkmenica DSM 5511]|uniref:Uncharacterized protein n=1 Tax=Haloterrigena turkmenica (strain ATCC 51198 / DSM 5511 / JCM 9101 / NCIMB 13204 / VKM B-1734 / 4k) TaxID=543526 RepID=D2S265_HALTV|nr:hypothetical protein Htur_4684 [Haloterrigena turkmenica DSM 5511]
MRKVSTAGDLSHFVVKTGEREQFPTHEPLQAYVCNKFCGICYDTYLIAEITVLVLSIHAAKNCYIGNENRHHSIFPTTKQIFSSRTTISGFDLTIIVIQ